LLLGRGLVFGQRGPLARGGGRDVYRSGALAFVRALWHRPVLPLDGSRAAMTAERSAGLRSEVAGDARITDADTVIIFANSGINPYPVEIAEIPGDAGLTVVAVTSTVASAAAPLPAEKRLAEVAHVVLDAVVPPETRAGRPHVGSLQSVRAVTATHPAYRLWPVCGPRIRLVITYEAGGPTSKSFLTRAKPCACTPHDRPDTTSLPRSDTASPRSITGHETAPDKGLCH
jgi:SIS domain